MTPKTQYIQGSNGHKLFTRSWHPDNEPKAILFIAHGYAEHSGRYEHVGKFFAEHGFLVCALDHQAHGKSEGKDTYVESFDYFLDDLDLYIKETKLETPDKPAFLLGHSMGGGIAAAYAMKYKPDLAGVILSAPTIILGDDITPFMVKLANFLSKIAPKMKTIKLDSSSVSRDPKVVAKYDSDPLNYRGGIPARTGSEINKATLFVQDNLDKFNHPCFLANGSSDRLVNPGVSQLVYDNCSSEDKTIKIYDGLFHEILNEPEKEIVMSDMFEWMNTRL